MDTGDDNAPPAFGIKEWNEFEKKNILKLQTYLPGLNRLSYDQIFRWAKGIVLNLY